MSLLFSSILLLVVISPGLIFGFSYLQGTYAKINVPQIDDRYYQMPGELFTIHYDKVVNMNVTFHRINPDDIRNHERWKE